MTKQRPTFDQFKNKALQDKEVKTEYDLLEIEFQLIELSIRERQKERLANLGSEK